MAPVHSCVLLFFLFLSCTADSDNPRNRLEKSLSDELILKVSQLEETVGQQWAFIKQLAQRVDAQEEMLRKFNTEDVYVQSNNKTSRIQQTLDPLIPESDEMEMAADDPRASPIDNRNEASSHSWSQLEISPNIVGSVRYANFRVDVYEHARNSKMDNNDKQSQQCSCGIEYKKYYYKPIAMLDSNSAHSSYNNVTNRPEMTFWIEMWNDNVEKAVNDWVNKHKFGNKLIGNQVEVIPFEKIIMTTASSSSEEQRNYYLDNVWISYQRQDRVKFKFICYRLNDCDELARQMRLNPDQFSHLHLQFSMASVKSQTRETKIRVGNIVTGDMASKLLQRMPEGDVLLKAEDEKRLVSESATNIFIETFDDSDVVPPNSQQQINNQLKELLVSSRMIIKEQSDKMWDSVFWNDDNYRPDKTTKEWNEIYKKLDKEKQAALVDVFKFDGNLEAEVSFKLLGGLASFTPKLAGSISTDKSLSNETLDRLYQASKNSVSWNGEKFVPKQLSLARVNLAKLRDQQSLQTRSLRLSYATSVLSVNINMPSTKHSTIPSSSNALNEIHSQLQELKSRVNPKSTPGPIPSNCTELSNSGHSLNGLYLVADSSRNRVKTVYCDFTRLPHNEGYQKDFGYNSITDSESVSTGSSTMPTNCSELYKLGHRIDGFYPVKNHNIDNNIKRLDIIYCVFNKPFSSLSSGLDSEFNRTNHGETRIGFADVKLAPIFFHATRKSRFFAIDTRFTFEKILVNVGRGMDLKTGVFTAPYSGQYSFHFNGFKDALVDELHVVLKLNGQTDLASSYIASPNGGSSHLSPFFLHTIASLKAGDKVSLYLMEGSIAESIDNTGHGNNFFGFLLHQELSFE